MKGILIKLKFLIEKNQTIANIFRFVYRQTVLKYRHRKQRKLLHSVGKTAMQKLNEAFEELKIPYWLTYGTLLGAYRDKGFISHDLDIDLGLFLSDYSNLIDIKLSEKGFIRERKITIDNGDYGLEETYNYKGIGIDLFYFTQRGNEVYSHGFINEEGTSWEKTVAKYGGYLVRELSFPWEGNIERIDFLGAKYPIPPCIEKHLASFYGDNFMIKNAKWDNRVATNVIYLKDKIGVPKYYESK